MRSWKHLALLGVTLLSAACGSEPTAVRTPARPARDASSLTVTITAPQTIYQSSCNTWSASVSGGTAPYQYLWSGFSYTVPNATSPTVQAGIDGWGSYTLTLQITDAAGQQKTVAFPVYVTKTDTPPVGRCIDPVVTITGPTTVWQSDCNMWSASATGGTPPYTYEWEGFDYMNLDNTGASLQAGFWAYGNHVVNLWVTDAAGTTVLKQFGVYAQPAGNHFVEPCTGA